ncbi:MAG: peptidoglycan DD-metalloendopeptidase family protein, partial [bacterium]|nr:peptidoglycan DD-metalloendopeptidase family protein [bacterium]
FAAVDESGGDPDLAVRLAEIFQWDIDFFRDLRQGDRFVVIVDERTIEGEFFDYGNVFAARFINRDRILNAIAYQDGDGRVGYFDLEGNPLRKQFLRSPLKFSRITSRFSLRRFHPVLKRRMPHYGVDYGAPVGTPAHATADGTVTFVGRNGGAGRMVTLRHTNGFETSYLHLNGYGKGVRRGARISQGQVVGFVGSSGLSTGPHLDYRVKQNGRYINPLTLAAPAAEPLPDATLPRFLSHALAVLELLEGRDPPEGASC